MEAGHRLRAEKTCSLCSSVQSRVEKKRERTSAVEHLWVLLRWGRGEGLAMYTLVDTKKGVWGVSQ